MGGYSEDLRRRIVSAVERGTSKSQAARTFFVSLSSVLGKALRGQGAARRIAGPEEESWVCSEAGRESEKALGGRPCRAPLRHPSGPLRLHRGHHGALGEPLDDVSGRSPDRLHEEKGGRSATERDEFERAAWRVMVAAAVDEPERLIFVDEMGAHTSLAPVYGYALKGGERLHLSVPRNRGKNTTLLSSMTLAGMGPSLAVEGATTARVFETYVERVLAPSLEPGQLVVMDNLGAHKPARVRQLIECRGSANCSICRPTRRITTRSRRRSPRSRTCSGRPRPGPEKLWWKRWARRYPRSPPGTPEASSSMPDTGKVRVSYRETCCQ